MLRSSILDTMELIGDAKAAGTFVELIHSLESGTVDMSLHLPQILNLVCRSGDRDAIGALLKKVGDNAMYADSIIAGLLLALRRFPDILQDVALCVIAVNLLTNEENDDDVRLKIAELIGNKTYPNALTSDQLLAIGRSLLQNQAMTVGGLMLLKACDTEEAFVYIRQALYHTGNEELKLLYEDLLNGELAAIRNSGYPDSSSTK